MKRLQMQAQPNGFGQIKSGSSPLEFRSWLRFQSMMRVGLRNRIRAGQWAVSLSRCFWGNGFNAGASQRASRQP